MLNSNSVASLSKQPSIIKPPLQTDNTSKAPANAEKPESYFDDPKALEHHSDTVLELQKEEDSFFHIAYTPSECTFICSEIQYTRYFSKPISVCSQLGYEDVVRVEQSFISLQVDSEGDCNNSARILELTKPLSQNNISLYFLSNHYTNIVLIPSEFQEKVVEILVQNKFVFFELSNSYIIDLTLETETEVALAHDYEFVSSSTSNAAIELLKSHNIMPKLHRKIKLLLTGVRLGEVKQSILKAAQSIAANAVPPYFAITRSSSSEVSLILPGSSYERAIMGFDSRSIIGLNLDVITPITVDLTELPLDSTGIVAGLASSLLENTSLASDLSAEVLQMNYLSMARSAIILIPQENVNVATSMLTRHFGENDAK